jgi:hemerythrin-like domain-containing protein
MGLPTQPMRDEHLGFTDAVELLRTTADEVGTAPVDELRDDLEQSYLFLEEKILAHARAEDLVLYPAIARLMGYEHALASMTLDHVEIGTLANELGIMRLELVDEEQPPAALLQEIRRVLYGIYALVKAHIGKEEALYFPILDANLNDGEAQTLMDEMETVTRKNRFHLG